VPDLPSTAMLMVCTSEYDAGATATPPTALVVEVLVDLDLSTTDSFRRVFAALLGDLTADGQVPADPIVLDLSRVEFMSLDGASALVEAKDAAARKGLDLRLVTATRGVDHALAATGARRMFDCHSTVGSALACGSRRSGALADRPY